ncbi:MAG: M3 family peptidase, partial [Myxococcota bacterium]
SPEIQKLSGTIRPMLAKVTDQVNFNPKLFARVKAIYDTRETSGLNAEQKRLVEKYYEGFVRRGANLDEAQKKRMGESCR